MTDNAAVIISKAMLQIMRAWLYFQYGKAQKALEAVGGTL